MSDESFGCEIPRVNAPSEEIARLLTNSKTIAVVGLSPKSVRPSFEVAQYLQTHGYRIFPVNPGQKEILGEKVYPSLLEIPEPVDVVDVFRRPEALDEVADQAIQIKAKVLWFQLGLVNNTAAEKAKKAGLIVIQNKCMLIEHANLGD